MTNHPKRAIRSYVLRSGRMTDAQQRAYEEQWHRWGVDPGGQPLDLCQLFGRAAPTVLEIGFGMGQSLAEMAAREPAHNFLGIEVHRAGVGKLLHLVNDARLENVRVICHDATEILRDAIAPDCIDKVQIFFPDPWHKKRHHKRRLIQAEFVDLLASRLKSGGVVHLATDWEPYAHQMLEVLSACSALENCSAGGGFAPRPEARPVTKFEQRGQKLGHGVWDLLFQRR